MSMDEEIESTHETSKVFAASAESSGFIAELYPELTPEQQEEAVYFLNRYLDLIERIYDRTHS